jgi:DNA-directed RNA polymerase specialized sigma24 family protein
MTSHDTNPQPRVFVFDTKRQKTFFDAVTLRDEFVRGYLFSLIRHDDVAKDLAQKTWLAVYRSFKEENFTNTALLKRKAWQTFVSYMRAIKTRDFVSFTDDLDELAPVYIQKEEEGSQAEAAFEAKFWERFLPLEFDPTDRQMFMLKERYGYTGAEIAAKVGLPVSTVHHRIEALKRAAKAQLEKDI